MAKKKGSIGGNPNPVQTEVFKAKQFPPAEDMPVPMAKQPISVKLPADLDALIKTLPDKAAWVRRVLAEAAAKELGYKIPGQ